MRTLPWPDPVSVSDSGHARLFLPRLTVRCSAAGHLRAASHRRCSFGDRGADPGGGCRGMPTGFGVVPLRHCVGAGAVLTPSSGCVVPAGLEGGHFQLYALDGKSEVSWRLLSANNRELGRGAVDYSSVDDCLASIRGMISRLDGLITQARRRPDSGWHWVLLAEDEPVVVGGRGYDRPIRAREAARRFRAHARRARIAETVTVNGSRRWNRAGRGSPIRTGSDGTRPIRDRDTA